MSLTLNSQNGNIISGGDGSDGDVILKRNDGTNCIHLDGHGGNAWLGGNGADGDVVLFSTDGDNRTLSNATMHLDGQQANIFAGGQNKDGDIVLRSGAGQNRIRLDAGGGNLWMGGHGADGDIVLFDTSGDNQTLSQATIHLNGQAGDIVLQNADCAEQFSVESAQELQPGSVVVISGDTTMKQSDKPYDKCVGGIIAGAGDLRPGIVLGRNSGENQLPIALMGRVWCKADASYGSIEIGDLLTTSATAGHAMVANDPSKSHGAILGKALTKLESGQGMIRVLVTLQ